MSYTIERKNNPAHYLVTMPEDFNLDTDLVAYFRELARDIKNEAKPLSVVLDMLNYSVSLNDLLSATKDLMDIDENPYQHPNAKQLIIVTDSKMIKMSMDGFRKFGIVKKFHAVDSLNEAMRLV